MKSKLFIALLVFSLLFGSCRQSESTSKKEPLKQITSLDFNPKHLLKYIKIVSSDDFEGRRTGSQGSEKARHYIIEKLKSLNIDPLFKDYEQNFSFNTDVETYNATNILGIKSGTSIPEKYIVISAHYDHEGIKNGEIYNGADDNASGVAGLLAIAEYLKKNTPKHSIILAFFDAEELGLKGSKYYVDNPGVDLSSILLNINMDMISKNEHQELYVSGVKSHAKLQDIISKYPSSKDLTLLVGHDGYDGKVDWTYASDHSSFHKNNIPYLYFGVEDHKDLHKPTDDFENIDPEFFKNSVQTIISIFKELDTTAF